MGVGSDILDWGLVLGFFGGLMIVMLAEGSTPQSVFKMFLKELAITVGLSFAGFAIAGETIRLIANDMLPIALITGLLAIIALVVAYGTVEKSATAYLLWQSDRYQKRQEKKAAKKAKKANDGR